MISTYSRSAVLAEAKSSVASEEMQSGILDAMRRCGGRDALIQGVAMRAVTAVATRKRTPRSVNVESPFATSNCRSLLLRRAWSEFVARRVTHGQWLMDSTTRQELHASASLARIPRQRESWRMVAARVGATLHLFEANGSDGTSIGEAAGSSRNASADSTHKLQS